MHFEEYLNQISSLCSGSWDFATMIRAISGYELYNYILQCYHKHTFIHNKSNHDQVNEYMLDNLFFLSSLSWQWHTHTVSFSVVSYLYKLAYPPSFAKENHVVYVVVIYNELTPSSVSIFLNLCLNIQNMS